MSLASVITRYVQATATPEGRQAIAATMKARHYGVWYKAARAAMDEGREFSFITK